MHILTTQEEFQNYIMKDLEIQIYAHKATCDLCTLMLPDSGHIQEMENEWKNKKRKRKGEKEVPPLYTAEEAARCLEIFEPIQYDEIIEITPEYPC